MDSDEVELADRADVLAERRAGERQIDDQRRARNSRPPARRSPPAAPTGRTARRRTARRRTAPSATHFFREPPRPVPRRPVQPAAEIAHQDHRAGAAERVAGGKQRADEQSAIVNPRQHRRRGSSARAAAREARARRSTIATSSRTICVAVRSRRQRSSAPTIGQRSTSVSTVAGGDWASSGDIEGPGDACASSRGRTLATSMRRSTRAPSGSAAETSSTQSPCMVNANGSVVDARRALGGVRQHRRHPGVRHVPLEPHRGAFHRIAGRSAKGNRQGGGTDGGRLPGEASMRHPAVDRSGGFDRRRRSTGWRPSSSASQRHVIRRGGAHAADGHSRVYGARALRPCAFSAAAGTGGSTSRSPSG